ncbi:heparinase II/III domain-containing protein [Bacillus wiedmannii]|uniref:heparinase II/III domain-containing protein n=1 Tax=Bacillus wiedmannii TaxID=1890302 RepID=UPI000BF2F7FF|nr:heparinase II/III family protein [Bacillus wiedmannii]PFZ67921.1 hypothetical protein COL76_00030 [Bacillus wiedmannii]PHB64639.1 hypothetical protein COE87_06610 [Bacillus wiedmannii]
MEYNVKLRELKTNQIIKIYKTSKDTLRVANLILDNKFHFFNSLDVIDFNEGIDWNYRHHTAPDTYQLYMHALNVLCHLLNAYEQTNDEEYLEKSREIFLSWINYEKQKPNNKMLWYDHPTAYRTHNLVYLALIAKEKLPIEEKEYIELLVTHGKYLFDDKNYHKNNHGIMMDRALIMLGIILDHPESNRWIEKGIWRLKDTFYFSYSQQGVHLENSPEYHRIVRNLYKSIENFLNKNDLTLGEDVVTRLEMSDEYFNYIVKPNGLTPAIGDSGLLPIGAQNKIYDSFHDQVAGITVMQSKDEDNPENSTWLSFVCGYGTTTHKHYDDLSVNIFYKGHDILVDPGKYSYGRSPVRSYVISPQAHNTIAFPNERYVFDKSQGVNRKIKTTSFVSTNKMDMVQGINGGYKDTLFKRTVIFLKPNLVIFLDEIISENSVKVSQYFNLAPHIEIKEVMDSKIRMISDNEIIEFEQINDVDSVNIHKGQANPPKAIISEQFGKTTETNQLEFSKNVNSDYLLTAIKLGKEAIDNFNFASFDKINRLISIEMSNQNIQFYV